MFGNTYLYQTFTECVSNLYTFISKSDIPSVTASYGTVFDCIAFFWVFSYKIDNNLCLNFCLFTKLSQKMSNLGTYIKLPDETIDYERFSDLIFVF